MQVDATCATSGLIFTKEVSSETNPILGPTTNSTIQEQNRVKPDPMTQSTTGLKRKRTLIVFTEPELIEIDRVLLVLGVTEAELQEWKPIKM